MKYRCKGKSLNVLARGFMRYEKLLYARYDILGEETAERTTVQLWERRMKAHHEAQAIHERMDILAWHIAVQFSKSIGLDTTRLEA